MVKGFVKMTENNYVIKENPSKHEKSNQCWAEVGPRRRRWAHQPSIGSMSRVCRDGVVSNGNSFGGRPPAKTGHQPCVGSMLAHCQRCWPNIEPAEGQCHVFAGGAPGADRSVTIR